MIYFTIIITLLFIIVNKFLFIIIFVSYFKSITPLAITQKAKNKTEIPPVIFFERKHHKEKLKVLTAPMAIIIKIKKSINIFSPYSSDERIVSPVLLMLNSTSHENSASL